MNNDLISRGNLQGLLRVIRDRESGTPAVMLDWFNDIVSEAPSVDAEPVKHGIWEEDPYVWRCSECHKWLMVEQGDADMNFCTHCGARMDGRVE